MEVWDDCFLWLACIVHLSIVLLWERGRPARIIGNLGAPVRIYDDYGGGRGRPRSHIAWRCKVIGLFCDSDGDGLTFA